MSETLFDYSKLQDRIDKLDDTKWLQPNAFYPVKFFYTDTDTATKDFTVDTFLKMHTNNTGKVAASAGSSTGTLLYTNADSPKTLTEYIQKESELSGKEATDVVMRQFSKLSGLKAYSVALTKNNGALKADTVDTKDTTVTLEFLCDRDFKVLDYLQAWQARWYTYDFQKRSLVAKAQSSSESRDRTGGEGFLGLANCIIDVNGNITVASHLSIFGLIPKKIETINTLGPQAGSSAISKITVVCTYAHAILIYPKKDTLGYYYYE